MNKEGQRRFCVFCVFVAVSCICSLVYAYMICNAMESVGNVKVSDGEGIMALDLLSSYESPPFEILEKNLDKVSKQLKPYELVILKE